MSMTETPMSDAELDALVAEATSQADWAGSRSASSAALAVTIARLADAITQLRSALAAAKRRVTERDAELAAAVAERDSWRREAIQHGKAAAKAVADNAHLIHIFERVYEEGNLSEDEMGGIRFILSTDRPGAALLREHERRGAVVEAARKPCDCVGGSYWRMHQRHQPDCPIQYALDALDVRAEAKEERA